MSGTSNRIAVVTVHGTGDTAKSAAGDKWFQTGSEFTNRLKGRLSQQGLEADILPLLWTGANSSQARDNAADKLADAVKAYAKRYAGVHIVGHSHGGNVANDAADFLRWGRRRLRTRERITSLTTVGTPFFRCHGDWIRAFAGYMFLAITVLSTLVTTPVGLILVGGRILELARNEARNGLMDAALVVAGAIVFVLAFVFMWRLALEQLRQIRRPRKKKASSPVEILSIWHPNDEAIAFLQRVEKFPLEPFPRGSWARGARMPAIHWGVNTILLALLAAVAGLIVIILGDSLIDVIALVLKRIQVVVGNTQLQGAVRNLSIGTVISGAAIATLLAPVVFYTVYALRRFIIGSSFDLTVRPWANHEIAGALRGMAFGRDDDQKLSQISTESHTLKTRSVKLEGELADRLQNGASKAASELIEKYRWSLFTVGSDTNSPLTSLATDAMTWNSLIHTTYFDQPEIADMIADHIAEAQRAESGAAPAPPAEAHAA